MSRSFSELKKSSRSDYKKTQEKIQNVTNPKNSSVDDRFWSLAIDSKTGNGNATIRFLPRAKGEDVPFVQTWSHAFKGLGGWYIENCLSTVGKTDPVNEMNTALWEKGEEDTVRQRKRKLNYYANIYVVDDPANPENNGKVFLFKFGKQIFDLVNEAMFPEDEDEPAVNVFDFWEGANFKLKSKKVSGFINYTSSKFLKPKPLSEDDQELEDIWNQQHSLTQFNDPDNTDQFKTYEQLKARLIRVLGDEAAEFFGVSGKRMPAAEAPSVGKTAEPVETRQVLQEDDDEDDIVDVEDLDDSVDEELPWDVDDDDDLESFQSLAD